VGSFVTRSGGYGGSDLTVLYTRESEETFCTPRKSLLVSFSQWKISNETPRYGRWGVAGICGETLLPSRLELLVAECQDLADLDTPTLIGVEEIEEALHVLVGKNVVWHAHHMTDHLR